MSFKRISPPAALNGLIECYWIAENSDPAVVPEKIIPDATWERYGPLLKEKQKIQDASS